MIYALLLYRTIAVVEDTFNIILLILFLYFGTLFGCYGFVLMSVSKKIKKNFVI